MRRFLLIALFLGMSFFGFILFVIIAAGMAAHALENKPVDEIDDATKAEDEEIARSWEREALAIGERLGLEEIWNNEAMDPEERRRLIKKALAQGALIEPMVQAIHEYGMHLSPGLIRAIAVMTDNALDPKTSVDVLKPRNWDFEEGYRTTRYIYEGTDPNCRSTETKVKVALLTRIEIYNGTHYFAHKYVTDVEEMDEDYSPADVPGDEEAPEGEIIVKPAPEKPRERGNEEPPTCRLVRIEKTYPVIDWESSGTRWEIDYGRLYDYMRRANFLSEARNRYTSDFGIGEEDLLTVFRQAQAYDPSFSDPKTFAAILAEMYDVPGAGAPRGLPLPPEEIDAVIREAMIFTGVDISWYRALQWMVMAESGGNPKAFNPTRVWYSTKWGYQNAQGLMQLMPPTFEAYKAAGHGDIWNPLDNMIAAIRYIKARYGSPYNIPGIFTSSYRGY